MAVYSLYSYSDHPQHPRNYVDVADDDGFDTAYNLILNLEYIVILIFSKNLYCLQ